jgi:hypothetical protein
MSLFNLYIKRHCALPVSNVAQSTLFSPSSDYGRHRVSCHVVQTRIHARWLFASIHSNSYYYRSIDGTNILRFRNMSMRRPVKKHAFAAFYTSCGLFLCLERKARIRTKRNSLDADDTDDTDLKYINPCHPCHQRLKNHCTKLPRTRYIWRDVRLSRLKWLYSRWIRRTVARGAVFPQPALCG